MKDALKSEYTDIEAYVTRDGSLIRELLHPGSDPGKSLGVKNQSLAEATVPQGVTTKLHRHLMTEELYYILSGSGLMTLGEKQFEVSEGDSVCIQPATAHCIKNTGNDDLKILCCCSPAYRHEDTEILG
ncbi:cupin domain-containing protein [Kaarinaea lacus]